MRVLIVESKKDLGRIWMSCLERQGMEVQLVCDQESAFDALRENEFDIIIMRGSSL